jgi:hypothetical protein
MLALENLTIVSLTQHWVLVDGAWYRDAWVQDLAGCVRLVGILDDLLP